MIKELEEDEIKVSYSAQYNEVVIEFLHHEIILDKNMALDLADAIKDCAKRIIELNMN